MFGSVEPTAYDLRFSIAGIPVRVSPWFWLVGVIFGYQELRIGFDFLLAWLAVFFASILVHELGHAFTARTFGYPPRIVLYQFGGLAMYEPYRNFTRGKSIAISLAGPGAGFLLYGLTWLVATVLGFRVTGAELNFARIGGQLDRSQLLVWSMVSQLLFVNLYWTILNLLPVLPLDGGRVCQEVCSIWSPASGTRLALRIGAVVAGAAAAFFFSQHQTYAAVLFGLLCAENISAFQQRPS